MILKRDLLVRICELESEVDYLFQQLEDKKPKKKTTRKVKKNAVTK